MKTIITTFILTMSLILSAQVSIGKPTVDGTNTILDFGVENKGVVLPRVITKEAGSVAGTLLYDTTDKKIKYKNNTDWQDLSIESGTIDLTNYITELNSLTELNSSDKNGVVIGEVSSTAPGVLVLEAPTTHRSMAMILPKVASPHTEIINPEPGTIAYDSTKNMLSVYNGTVWTFWKAQ